MDGAKKGAVLAAAAVLLVGTVLTAPSFVDWSRHKNVVADRLHALTGRPVTLDGQLSLSLLPTPRFKAEGVAVANAEGASDPWLLKIKRLELRLDPKALIQGRFEASSLVLVGPELFLETFPDGGANWYVHRTQAQGANGAVGAETPSQPKDAAPARIDSVSIEDGVLSVRTPGRPNLRLEGIRASASADPSAYRGNGRAQWGGTVFAFDLAAGRDIGTGLAQASLALSLPGHRSDMRVTGIVEPGWAGFSGKMTATSADFYDFAKTLGANPAGLPATDLRIDAALAADGQKIAAKDIKVSLSGQTATGEAELDLTGRPHGGIDLSFKTLDVDALQAPEVTRKPLPPAPPPPSPTEKTVSAPDTPPTTRPYSWKGIDTDFRLSSDLITYKGAKIRRAHLNGQIENGEILIDQASAELPGDADVNLFGYVSLASGEPEFEGSIEAVATDLRGFLAWTGMDLGNEALDRLRAFKLTGDLRAAPGRVNLQGAKVSVDSSKLEGSLDIDTTARPKVALTFVLDGANLDAYRPLLSKPAETAPAVPAKEAKESVPAKQGANLPEPRGWLDGVDARVQGRIGQLAADGANLKDVVVDGSWDGQKLALKGLSIGDMDGTEIRARGGYSATPAAFHDLEFAVRTQKPDRLAALAAVRLPFPAERIGPAVLAGRIDGPLGNLSINARAEAAGAVASMSGSVAGLPGHPVLDASVEASHSSLTQLIRLFRPDYRPRGALGAFAASVRLGHEGDALTLSDLRLKLGPIAAAGEATIGPDNRVDAHLTTDEIGVDPFLPATRKAGLPSSLRTALYAPPPLGASLAATGTHEHPPVVAAPRPKVEQGDITGRWSNDPIGLDMLNGLAGSLKLDARAVSWAGARLDGVHADFALDGGTARVQTLTGKLYGGKLEASCLLSSEGAVSVKASLAHARMQEALPGLAGLDIADGTADMTMEAQTNGLSMNEMIGRLGGKAKISVVDGRIKGFDLAAMNAKVASSGNMIGLIGGIQAGMNGGSTRFSSFGGTIHAVDGIITTEDLALVAEGGGANASGAVNLPLNVMDAKADFHLAAAGGNTPPLVLRVTGPLDHPRRFIDINAIQSWIARQGGAPADQEDGKSKKIKPKDVLKGLLEGLH